MVMCSPRKTGHGLAECRSAHARVRAGGAGLRSAAPLKSWPSCFASHWSFTRPRPKRRKTKESKSEGTRAVGRAEVCDRGCVARAALPWNEARAASAVPVIEISLAFIRLAIVVEVGADDDVGVAVAVDVARRRDREAELRAYLVALGRPGRRGGQT